MAKNAMKLITIEATTLSDAWYQCLYKAVEEGRQFKIDKGSYKGQVRLEFDYITVQIKNPWVEPLLPKTPEILGSIPDPVEEGYLNDYLPYLMTAEKKPGETYTYGSRLCHVFTPEYDEVRHLSYFHESRQALSQRYEDMIFSQIDEIIYNYKTHGHRSNQEVLQIAQPSDLKLDDPPCLRGIDTRIQDGTLHFFPYFRSWDLWGGFPANLAAIEMLKQYMAGEIGVNNGQIIAASKGLHLYDYVFELAEALRGKKIKC